MNTGKHAFSVVFNYVLAAMNNAATQPLAGQFAMALMPGAAHATLGFCQVLRDDRAGGGRPRRARGSLEVHRVHGRRRLSDRQALGGREGPRLCQLPLFDDPDVQEAWSGWIDVETFKTQAGLAGNGTWTEWPGMWSAYFRPLLAQAMVGEASVAEVMDAGAKWLELRKLVRGA